MTWLKPFKRWEFALVVALVVEILVLGAINPNFLNLREPAVFDQRLHARHLRRAGPDAGDHHRRHRHLGRVHHGARVDRARPHLGRQRRHLSGGGDGVAGRLPWPAPSTAPSSPSPTSRRWSSRSARCSCSPASPPACPASSPISASRHMAPAASPPISTKASPACRWSSAISRSAASAGCRTR